MHCRVDLTNLHYRRKLFWRLTVKHFPYLRSNWANHTARIIIHAELRIILHFSLPFPKPPSAPCSVQPIRASKRSRFCCTLTLWMEAHNRILSTRWMTSKSQVKPRANWAFPDSACSYTVLGADGKSSVDKWVLGAVSVRLTDTLDWLFPR